MLHIIINGVSVDIDNNTQIRINRQILNPAEISTKDARYTYSIQLPPTRNNNKAFKLSNIEEVKGKFEREYEAVIYVNSTMLISGLFRLSEYSAKGYKGNIYKPKQVSVKDAFGALTFAELAPFRIPFGDFNDTVNGINREALTAHQRAVFPFALYGVLPKVPLNKDANRFTPRAEYDDTVRLGMADIPPSLNVLMLVRHIFESNGYRVVGNAFNDPRLNGLYQSYKNEDDYTMPWNYGYHGVIRVKGGWSSATNRRTGSRSLEVGVFQPSQSSYSVDLFDSVNAKIDVTDDRGGNVLTKIVRDGNGKEWSQTQIRVPASGLYKVFFTASSKFNDSNNWRETEPISRVQHVSGESSKVDNPLHKRLIQVALYRDRKGGDFGLARAPLSGTYYQDNQPQNDIFDRDNSPKLFPDISSPDSDIIFVDTVQDRYVVLGTSMGAHADAYRNPLNKDNLAHLIVAKPSLSWDSRESEADRALLAIKSKGYKKYGVINAESELPEGAVDFSGGDIRTGVSLDANGEPEADTNTQKALIKFPLSNKYTYTIQGKQAYFRDLFIKDGDSVHKVQTKNGNAVFTVPDGYRYPTLTMYLTLDSGEDAELVLEQELTEESAESFGWSDTDIYRIDLDYAPRSYAVRGTYADEPINIRWGGQGSAHAVVWFDAGELLTVGAVSSDGAYRRSGMSSVFGMIDQSVEFDLRLEPFRIDKDWLKVDVRGVGTGVMDWRDTPNFDTDSINIYGFTPQKMKLNDYLENLCKAFNLSLVQLGNGVYSLDSKQTTSASSSLYVDLEAKAFNRTSAPLGLPSEYAIGYTVDQDEEGFKRTGDDGGGTFYTGATDGAKVEQKSSFSFNWFKELTKDGGRFSVPIISKADVWAESMPYPEAMGKRFTDLGLRFWAINGYLNSEFSFNGKSLKLLSASNVSEGLSLNYKNKAGTILKEFFTVMVDSASHYTNVEARLTAGDFEGLDGSRMVKYNGDFYLIAQIDGYDPTGVNKCKVKMIKK